MHRYLMTFVAVSALTALHAACATNSPPAIRHRASTSTAMVPAQPPAAPTGKPVATSLLGKSLFATPIPDTRRGQLEANAAIAKRGHDLNPKGEGEAILYGRRLGALCQFDRAIAVYTTAIAANPASYRLLRHRGHRYISTRRFDLALADLNKAWQLANDKSDAVEPDLDPKPDIHGVLPQPTSTDKSNILYHLGLTYYLKGQFDKAAETFARRTELAARGEKLSDDSLVSFLNWHFLATMRAGHKDEAVEMLGEFRPDMNIRDNGAYFALLRVYRGEVPADVLAAGSETAISSNLAMVYGVGAWKLINGDATAAKAIFEKLAANKAWPSFGVVAAEAELAREQITSAEPQR